MNPLGPILQTPIRTHFYTSRYKPILAIVVHVTDGPTLDGALSWFNNPASKVSANYIIDIDGSRIVQPVADNLAAWHSGIYPATYQVLLKSRPDLTWLPESAGDINQVTLGVEHVGVPPAPWQFGQMQTSAKLLAMLCAKYSIPIDRTHIVGHHEIYALHANCPNCDLDLLVKLAQVAMDADKPEGK